MNVHAPPYVYEAALEAAVNATETPQLLGYRRKAFARALGISLPTLERWLAAGIVRSVRLGGTIIIPASEGVRLMTVDVPDDGES